MSEKGSCSLCDQTDVMLDIDGFCINVTRCERRRKSLIREELFLLRRTRKLMLAKRLDDVALVISNVMFDHYGVGE